MTATLNEFDAMVANLVAMKVPREKAEAAARKELGIQPKSELEKIRDEAELAELEDEHVEAGDRLMGALGFTVVRLSQKRASKVTPGLPDRRYYHGKRRLFVWWEAKAEWGRQSKAQREFQILVESADDPYVLGGIDALKAWLVENNVATFDERGLPQPIPVSDELERYWRQKQTYAAVLETWRAGGGLGPEPPRPQPPSRS